MNDIKTDRRWTRCVPRIRPLWSSWNSRRKSFYNFGNIIMIGEFPSGISAATDSTLAYIFIRINITSTRMRFRFRLLEEAVIFKFLKYTVPSLARSFVHSLVPIVHWKHLSLQERKVFTTLFRHSKRWAFNHVSSDSLDKWWREANERRKRILLLYKTWVLYRAIIITVIKFFILRWRSIVS